MDVAILTIVAVIDWEALRVELVRLHDEHWRGEKKAFAAAVGVRPETVSRILKKKHSKRPVDLTTIVGWLRACNQLDRVGVFVQKFLTNPVTDSGDTLAGIPFDGARDAGAATLQGDQPVLTDAEAAFAEKLAFILLGAVQARRVGAPTVRLGDPQSARRAPRTGVGGQDSQTPGRLEPD